MGGGNGRRAIWLIVVVAFLLSTMAIFFSSLPILNGLTIARQEQELSLVVDLPATSTDHSMDLVKIEPLGISKGNNRRNNETGLSIDPKPHPHAGARDANGNWGYVANVHLVRQWVESEYQHQRHQRQGLSPGKNNDKHPPPSFLLFRDDGEFQAACNAKPREGKERKAGWRLLTQKVQVNGPDPTPLESDTQRNVSKSFNIPPLRYSNRRSNGGISRHPRILCAVYTYEKRHAMLSAVGETWGWKCDGFFAASTQTVDISSSSPHLNRTGLGAIDLPHLGLEQYQNMWQKTRSILAYMHDHYLNDFDFFFLSGDDTYVIVENLRRALAALGEAALEWPLYYGQWIPDGTQGNYFCGGGPGYVLNRKTLEILVKNVLPTCLSTLETSAEDRTLGWCLRTVGIVGNHSVDATFAQRFHGMDPHDTCTMKGDSGFFGKVYNFWGQHYGFKTGFNLTSSQSVSFHLLKTARHLKRIHSILYKSCPPNTTIGALLGRPT